MQVDQSGRGVLTPADIRGFLTELGLEPTSSDVLHIIDELDWSGGGIVSRSSVICNAAPGDSVALSTSHTLAVCRTAQVFLCKCY